MCANNSSSCLALQICSRCAQPRLPLRLAEPLGLRASNSHAGTRWPCVLMGTAAGAGR